MPKLWSNDETRPLKCSRAKVHLDGKYLGEFEINVTVDWEKYGTVSTTELFLTTPKIEAGDGYRLIGEKEMLREGDEFLWKSSKQWDSVQRLWDSSKDCEPYAEDVYRRRNRFHQAEVVVCTANTFDIYNHLGTVIGPDDPADLLKVVFMSPTGLVTRTVSGCHLAPVSSARADKYRELLKAYSDTREAKDKAHQAALSAGITLENILAKFKSI